MREISSRKSFDPRAVGKAKQTRGRIVKDSESQEFPADVPIECECYDEVVLEGFVGSDHSSASCTVVCITLKTLLWLQQIMSTASHVGSQMQIQ